MEPQFSSPDASGERQLPPRGEQFAPQQPERPAPAGPERQDETRERATGAGRGDTPPPLAQPVPLPPPVPAAPPAATPSVGPATGSPATAADDDLIEKEWVDKAKQIISETRQDPYMQEQQVNKLQADYLQKRYGKTINESDSE